MYTVVINGKPEGPYRIEELKALGIKPSTFVRGEGMEDYKEAHEIAALRELFGFNFQQTAPQYFASFDQRLLAVAIDYFFVFLAYALFLLIAFIFVQEKLPRITLSVAGLPSVPLAKFIYSCVADASAHQGTIGKRLMVIKVGDLLGNRIPLNVSILRNLSKLISTLPLFFGYLYCFLNRKQQCWHDLIAETLVTKQRLI